MKTLVKMNFNPDIAKDVGVDAAILIENIAYWIDRNQANQGNKKQQPSFQEGKWWTYNSSFAFANQFVWLSQKQIERLLSKLEKKNYLITGNFNKIKYDRTKWYALGENPFLDSYKSISRNREIETTLSGNRNDESVEPIPNSNINKKREREKLSHSPASQGSLRSQTNKAEVGKEVSDKSNPTSKQKSSGFNKDVEWHRYREALNTPGFIDQFLGYNNKGVWVSRNDVNESAEKCFAWNCEKLRSPNDWKATLYLWIKNERIDDE